ncbi:P-loop containing nucleoside triphosphate hydrolase protein [Lasiosphaeria ovina]|uniref:P-loop containing nucleoside triphosphate hydrolase protein n=1 Tax=Lasiosphaeria ovina TaxID=92902 RepID=A0AAE0JZH5_9PEZI|nr:P-loop containing nucleoside triphosphate hydrolase protein [Lasiosphaeria ovina]
MAAPSTLHADPPRPYASDSDGQTAAPNLPGETTTNDNGSSAKWDKAGGSSSSSPSSNNGSPGRSFLRVFSYTDRLGWCMNGVALFCMIASGSLLPLMDVVFGRFVTVFNNYIVGTISADEFRENLNYYTLFFVYLFIAKFVFVYIWTTLLAANAIRTTRALRIDFVKHTLRQEIAFFDSAEGGSVSGHVTTNCNLVNQGISEKLGLAIEAMSTFAAAFVVAFIVQWKLTLITAGIVPAIVIAACIGMIIDTQQENRIMTINSRAGRLAEEIFASMRTVHAFWAFPKLARNYEAVLDEARAVGMKKGPNMAFLFCSEFFCVYSGYALAFWQGIRMYQSGEISEPGKIITVIFAVLLAATALTQIAPQTVVISKAASAADQLFNIIDRESKIDALSDEGARPDELRGDIEFRNVVFAYPLRPNVPVLKGLDLSMPANKTTAIVGASGSGKSTVVGLIERWFTPLGGAVTLDGRSIDEYNLRWLRTNIRLVQQEPVMFNGTIFENVANGLSGTKLEDLDDEQKLKLVEDACRAAYAHEFIERLSEGYHTPIGERGAMLSGGQKQRLAIARSVISDPRVLLLDEATSALDPTAEHVVQKALNNVAAGRTMVVIAHRLSTVRTADNIVVMGAAGAGVVEQGTHAELIARGGAYARLVLAQDLGEDRRDSDGDDEFADAEKDGQAPGGTGHGDVDEAAPAQAVEVAAATAGIAAATATSATVLSLAGEDAKSHGLNLLKCLYIIVLEQRGLWLVFGVFLLACIVGGATYPALAILFSRTLDTFTLTGDAMTERGDFFSLMFFVVALGNLVAYAALGYWCNTIAQDIVKSYRLEIFNSVLRQPMAFFDRPENKTGALVSHLASEPQRLQELLSFNLGLLVIIAINLVSSCVLAIVVGWKLGVVLVFGALPPLVLSGYLRIRLDFKLDADTAARFADSTALAAEAVMAVRTVASLALERVVIARYEARLRDIAAKSLGSLGWTMFWYALSQSISLLAMGLGFWYGGRLVSFGEYTMTQFYTIFIAVIFSGQAAATFFTYSTSITQAQHAANYIFRLRASVPPDNRDDCPPEGSSEKKDEAGVSLECRGLEFAYPQRPHAKVLKGVSVNITPGQFVAFVGASGCGKTTMVNLLERFYDPSAGTVMCDGVDFQTVHAGQYRREIALVQQEPVLYQGSVRDNIALGVDSTKPVSDEAILAACRQANIDAFVASLPDGLATPCGAQGLQFSGGQRQRIAIARALVRRPRLLLLDEATSSLDTESERVVQAALDAAAKGGDGQQRHTTVAVAHRLSTIKAADRIFVFSHGSVVEAGFHDELLAARGVYYNMCLG